MLKKAWIVTIHIFLLASCAFENPDRELARAIRSDPNIPVVMEKAKEIVSSGFTAGDGYSEVWIRDFNSFIELAAELHASEDVKENLRIFFRFQDEDGGVVDGFIPYSDDPGGGYDYIYSELEPDRMAHKNTVETDHESSLIQAVYKYITASGDHAFLDETIGGKTVADRLLLAVDFLMNERLNEEYGLIWGATTADWGDVQPEHPWGVYLTDDTHYAIDIYDNAMFLIALENLAELWPAQSDSLMQLHREISANTMKHLWDDSRSQFIPHIYLNGSPFPDGFDEHAIYQHGGTTMAIAAGLLSREQVLEALHRMRENVRAANAATIGLTLYPPYPEGFFQNPSMHPYGYQNGGDWTWFGGRMIQQLIRYGYVAEAYEEAIPMFERVVENDGFYEWYTPDNKPMGSGTFRGSAGVLYTSIQMFNEWMDE